MDQVMIKGDGTLGHLLMGMKDSPCPPAKFSSSDEVSLEESSLKRLCALEEIEEGG